MQMVTLATDSFENVLVGSNLSLKLAAKIPSVLAALLESDKAQNCPSSYVYQPLYMDSGNHSDYISFYLHVISEAFIFIICMCVSFHMSVHC